MSLKTLIILRHAKSSWGDFTCPDFDRTLNKRGLRDGPFMASKLKEIMPDDLDLIITSPAKRALMTAQFFQKELDLGEDNFWTDKRLYHAYSDTILEVISECPDHYNSLLITGHNPGLTSFVNEFPPFETDNLPTASFVIIQLSISSWKNFNYGQGRVSAFHFPKQYFQ